jgi:CHAD domain-containing protein
MSTVEQSFVSNLQTVVSLLPSVRHGSREAIHDARVATRRLRAALPILSIDGPEAEWDEASRILRTAGRSLGRARDLDVGLGLLEDLERRAPADAPAAAAVRVALRRDQVKRQRKLIKRLESLDFHALPLANGAARRRVSRVLPWRVPPSRRAVIAAIHEGALALGAAVEHATGVYFPARAHAVRIAMKNLRYQVELLDVSEPGRRPALKVLRKEALGQIRDREVLADRLERMRRKGRVPGGRALQQLLEAESRSLFQKYLEQREKVLAVADALIQWSTRASLRRTRISAGALTVGALALPTAAVVLLANRTR